MYVSSGFICFIWIHGMHVNFIEFREKKKHWIIFTVSNAGASWGYDNNLVSKLILEEKGICIQDLDFSSLFVDHAVWLSILFVLKTLGTDKEKFLKKLVLFDCTLKSLSVLTFWLWFCWNLS